MGTPMIAVSTVAAMMYKNLGLTNAQIGFYTGSFYLAWVIKPLWAPFVELHRTKRFFVLGMELAMVGSFGMLALALHSPIWLVATNVLFWLTALASATQDIAADGIYIATMSAPEQAEYAGVQGIAWNSGRIIASGALVSLTGYLHDTRQLSWVSSWTVIMAALSVIMLVCWLWHQRMLPIGDVVVQRMDAADESKPAPRMLDAWVDFFAKPKILAMLGVVFFYRFGEGFIEKMGPLFMMDPRAQGGLGLSNTTLGNINGTLGTLGFLLGTFGGGLFAARIGLRRAFVPLALALNVPHITYFYLSQALPTNLTLITTVVTIEKIGYGAGTVGMMLYMMQQLAPGRFRTAHYAFATGVMALCMSVTGMLSGGIQARLGHQHFFLFVLAASVPPVIIAFLAPFVHEPETKASTPMGGH